MAEIQSTSYVLAVHDLEKSVAHYTNALGFKVLNEPPGWAFLGRGSFVVMLGECKDAIAPTDLGDHSYFAYVHLTDAETLYNEYLAKDVTIRKKLTEEDWGMKEFAIQTIDGHRIMFGESIDQP